HVLAVEGDVPSAREDKARAWRRIVEHRLGCSRRVPVDASRGHHDENPVASCDSALDDLAVVGRSRDDSDAPLECVELPHASLAAHSNHLVTAIQRLLDHVLPKLPRSPDDAHSHLFLPSVDRHPNLACIPGTTEKENAGVTEAQQGRPQCSGVSEGLPAFVSSFTILRADMKALRPAPKAMTCRASFRNAGRGENVDSRSALRRDAYSKHRQRTA